MMTRFSIMVLGGVFLAGTLHAQDLPQGDLARGETLMPKCRTCHGSDGLAKLMIAPNIAGEPESYLGAQLLAYRDGQRHNEMMSVVAAPLTDQDIADLAAWYAASNVTATLAGDPANAPEACVACHGANGIAAVDGVPHLAGDPEMYLSAQIDAYRTGTRLNETMSAIVGSVDEDALKSAVAWYARIGLDAEQGVGSGSE